MPQLDLRSPAQHCIEETRKPLFSTPTASKKALICYSSVNLIFKTCAACFTPRVLASTKHAQPHQDAPIKHLFASKRTP